MYPAWIGLGLIQTNLTQESLFNTKLREHSFTVSLGPDLMFIVFQNQLIFYIFTTKCRTTILAQSVDLIHFSLIIKFHVDRFLNYQIQSKIR